MILRFCSGSLTPARRSRNTAAASTATSGMLKWPRNSSTTCSASPARSRPVSTKTQVSWSPIASCRSSAVTAESTPPERPQITRPPPTCSRMRCDGRLAGRRPSTSRRGSRRHGGRSSGAAPAARGVHDLGMELHAVDAPGVVGDRGERRGVRGRDHAKARRQRRRSCRRGSSRPARARRARSTPSNSAQRSITSMKARPNSR